MTATSFTPEYKPVALPHGRHPTGASAGQGRATVRPELVLGHRIAQTRIMIDKRFRAKLQKSASKGAWTYVIWPESVKVFGTRGLVKIRGTINGQPFRGSFMAMGDGQHMLPIKSEVRKSIGKESGDRVSIHLIERLKK